MSTRQSPVALDLRSADFKDNPVPTWQRLQAQGPLITTRQPLLGRVVLATTHEACAAVLRDTDAFSVDATRAGKSQAAGMQWWVPRSFRTAANNMLVHDGAEHRRLRHRVDHAFRGESLAGLVPRIEAIAATAIDTMLRTGVADWLVVARSVPQQVISELLGLDATLSNRPATEERVRFDAALAQLASVHSSLDILRALPALRAVTRQLRCEFARRKIEPRNDLMSKLHNTHHAAGDAPLSADEQVSMAFLLYAAGHETTTHLLSVSLLTLLRTPEALASLPMPVTRNAVLELLRLTSPVQLTKPRFVTQDMEFHGVELRRGETIAALVGAANHDPRVFDEPERLDFRRNTRGQLGFGTGPHGCIGMQLAVQETAVTLTRLLQTCPALALAAPDSQPAWTRRLGLRSLARLPLKP